MNLDEMQHAWNDPANNIGTQQQQQLAERFTLQMRRRRRFQIAWLVNTFVALSAITVLALWSIGTYRTDAAREWALFPLLAVPWTFAVVFLRRFLRANRGSGNGELSVLETLGQALESNRRTQSNLRLVGLLYVISVPILVLTMRQLQAVGKVSDRELASMSLFFGATLGISALVVAVRYFLRVRPQQEQLSTLIAELSSR
ncbi:MAG TPA: hypothetical protein VEH04_15745 [Verrucomicrobiae bacterium]|nr:hypothetical protein [Verrucomicrobiae bacterium]